MDNHLNVADFPNTMFDAPETLDASQDVTTQIQVQVQKWTSTFMRCVVKNTCAHSKHQGFRCVSVAF